MLNSSERVALGIKMYDLIVWDKLSQHFCMTLNFIKRKTKMVRKIFALNHREKENKTTVGSLS